MSNVLFLNGPSHGHVNPTLGLVKALVNQGERVIYFCTDDFQSKIVKTGATFRSLGEHAKLPKVNSNLNKDQQLFDMALRMTLSTEKVVQHILDVIAYEPIDYLIYDSMYPIGCIIGQILRVPTVASHAVFAKPEELIPKNKNMVGMGIVNDHPALNEYRTMVQRMNETFNIDTPNLMGMTPHYGDLNIAYTSDYFVTDHSDYDQSFHFIGGPVCMLEETIDFPFDQLKDKKVIFISLGTAFNKVNLGIYSVFFDVFREEKNTVVVVAAYNTELSAFDIPENVIIKNYVPQEEILKYTSVAITHGGLNTTSDLVYNEVPFAVMPIGGDQPYMADRFAKLGATVILDKDTLTTAEIKEAFNTVQKPEYRSNLKKIKKSFEEAGGYEKAVEVIYEFKKKKILS